MRLDTFPIRILSEKTGVPTATIRAWERRYNILPAQRTESGHRYYTEDDVVYVSHLVASMEQGMTISKAIRKVENQLQQGQALTVQVRNNQTSQWQYYVDEMLLAVGQFDTQRLDKAYQKVMALFAVDVVTEQVLCPTLAALGARWQDRPAGIAEEHFFTTYLRNKIGARLHHDNSSNGPTIVVACVPHERHELGALLFALYAQNNGYRVISLGADLPLTQLSAVIKQVSAEAIVLSSTANRLDADTVKQLADTAAELTVPVLLGGAASTMANDSIDGVILLGNVFADAVTKLADNLR